MPGGPSQPAPRSPITGGGAIGRLRPLAGSDLNAVPDLLERAVDPIGSDPDLRLPFSPPMMAATATPHGQKIGIL